MIPEKEHDYRSITVKRHLLTDDMLDHPALNPGVSRSFKKQPAAAADERFYHRHPAPALRVLRWPRRVKRNAYASQIWKTQAH